MPRIPSLVRLLSKKHDTASLLAEAVEGEVLPPEQSSAAQDTQITLINNEVYVQKEGQAPTPLLSGRSLAIEISDDARCHIARKIARLLPDLNHAAKHELLAYTERVLIALCADQLERVRRIISEELKEYDQAPHEVILTLAQDEAISVAAPVLECSPVLTDHDLVKIITSSPIPGAVEAIAGRTRLSREVTDAVVKSSDGNAITRLLGNKTADISKRSLNRIVELAPDYEEWHEPLIMRPDLPSSTMDKLASFVSDSLIAMMKDSRLLDSGTLSTLREQVEDRLSSPRKERQRSATLSARELHRQGRLDSDAVDDAVVRGDKAFVCAALSLLGSFDEETVKRIIDAQNPKAITALCWEAGVSMRVSTQIQLRLARIHHTKVLHARGGRDYPLADNEMELYLDVFRPR